MRSFRAKPVGWQNDSYRHYLAQKGISTNKYRAPKTGLGKFVQGAFDRNDLFIARQRYGRAVGIQQDVARQQARLEAAKLAANRSLTEEERKKILADVELAKQKVVWTPQDMRERAARYEKQAKEYELQTKEKELEIEKLKNSPKRDSSNVGTVVVDEVNGKKNVAVRRLTPEERVVAQKKIEAEQEMKQEMRRVGKRKIENESQLENKVQSESQLEPIFSYRNTRTGTVTKVAKRRWRR
jgi:hypothetical protein